MSQQQHRDEHQERDRVTFGPDWTVTPRVAAGVLGVDLGYVHRLIETGVLRVQYEGRVRLVEMDSLLAYRRGRLLSQRLVTRPADTDKELNQRDD
ncbi:hypothetical protein [Streptomyces sp. PsTaAH-124]|uniref:hypothetical protein n=1 Tax=Streptomyces sp. PsTaAH-124 TaxID=1157638 RepID=UPI0003602009|nr:hypothetical protein [Streptomyces sp. PsTaAH-124]